MNPVISIIVPCYNQAQYLSETLLSVLNQDFQDWECLIINDGSPDNTEEVAKEWVAKDNRFKYLPKPNTGVSDTRNYGIRQAKGEYILPLDSDDKIDNLYIKKALEVFETIPDTKLVYSDIILFGKRNKEIVLPEYNFESLLFENILFSSAIFRRSDFIKTNGYNTNMANGLEDWDFWISFLNKDDKVIKINGFHFFYRIKDISRSTAIDGDQNEDLLLQIFKNHSDLYLKYLNPIRDHIKADYYKERYYLYKNSKEFKVGSIFYAPKAFIKKIFKKLFK